MCYDIITGLIDPNIRRLYMYDKPGRLCWPAPQKLHGRLHSFCKRKCFLYDFRVGHWPVGLWVGIWIAALKLNIYIYMSIKTIYMILEFTYTKFNNFNVPFFIRALNLIFSEKHICRFTPLVSACSGLPPQGEKY